MPHVENTLVKTWCLVLNHASVIKAPFFWTALTMKLGCKNALKDFTGKVNINLGSLLFSDLLHKKSFKITLIH